MVRYTNNYMQILPKIGWQFKEATRLRIYNYVKTKCEKKKTRNNFDRVVCVHLEDVARQ